MNIYTCINKNYYIYIRAAFIDEPFELLTTILYAFNKSITDIIFQGKYTVDNIADVDCIGGYGEGEEEIVMKIHVEELDDYIKIYFDMQGNYKDYEIGSQ